MIRPSHLTQLSCASLALAVMLCASAAWSTEIDNFEIGDGNTVTVDNLQIDYLAGGLEGEGAGVLSIDGTGRSSGVFDLGDAGIFSIDGTGLLFVDIELLSIDGTGRLQGGALLLEGEVAELELSGTLLEAEATDFRVVDLAGEGGEVSSTGRFDGAQNPNTSVFQILFSVTGGGAAGLFGDAFALEVTGTGYGGTFDENFSNNGDGGVRGGIPVPAPGTLWLLLAGGLAGLRTTLGRRKQRH